MNPFGRKWRSMEIHFLKDIKPNEFVDYLSKTYFELTNKKVNFTPFYESEYISIKYLSDGILSQNEEPKYKFNVEQTIDLIMEPKNMIRLKIKTFSKTNLQRLNSERKLFRVFGQYKCLGNIKTEMGNGNTDLGEILKAKKYTVELNEGYRKEFDVLKKFFKEQTTIYTTKQENK